MTYVLPAVDVGAQGVDDEQVDHGKDQVDGPESCDGADRSVPIKRNVREIEPLGEATDGVQDTNGEQVKAGQSGDLGIPLQ